MLPSARRNSRTVISFFVSVPVLSLQIVVTAPSVSTDESFLIIAIFRASTDAPSASAIVMVVGSHSGTAAMAVATENIRLSRMLSLRIIPTKKRIVQITNVTFATNLPMCSSSFWSGDFIFSVSVASLAIDQNRVCIPVFTTSKIPLPRAIAVPINIS